jgi:hypothetical protein
MKHFGKIGLGILALCLAILACNFPAPTPLVVPPAVLTRVAGTLIASIPSSQTPAPASPTPFEPATSTPDGGVTPSATPPLPTLAYQPAFETAECAFSIPPGTHPQCGYLVVPENRGRPGSPLIRL